MTNHDRYEYDVALSFAKEDEPVARKLGESLANKNIRVLYDKYENVQLAGGDFVTHIAELFRTKAQYCLMLISRYYPLKQWTKAERTSARQHALRDADEYILPIQLDDTQLPGISDAKGYHDLRHQSVEGIADWLDKKLGKAKSRSAPPTKSHDLRSGNVP